MKQKGSAPLLIVLFASLAVIVILVAFYFLSKKSSNFGVIVQNENATKTSTFPSLNSQLPSPTPPPSPPPPDPVYKRLDTTKWKTYTNFTGKYSLKIPPDWYITDNPKFAAEKEAPANALFQNKSFTEVPVNLYSVEGPIEDFAFGEMAYGNYSTGTRDEFYKTTDNIVQYANNVYMFPFNVLNLNTHKVKEIKMFPEKSFYREDQLFNTEMKDLVYVNFSILENMTGKTSGEVFSMGFYYSAEDPHRDEYINNIFNMLDTLVLK